MALPTLQLTWRKEGGSSLVRLFYKRAPISFWGALLSVQFSCSVVSNSLRPHVLQHARPPCPSPTPEFTQTHVHWVGDAIQPSHPLSSPSPPALNLSQHQGLFKWLSSSHQVAKVLELQLQHQSFQWTPRTDLLTQDKWKYISTQGLLPKSSMQH